MGFNYDSSINSNNLSEISVENDEIVEKKHEKSIFNQYFEKDKALMEQADLNKDGNLTAYEVRRWIELVLNPCGKLEDAIRNKAKDATLKIIKNIANMLGIVYDGYDPEAGELRKELVEELNNYQKIDTNRDGVITGEELDEANKTLSKSTTAMRNNEEGIVDGYIDNYQGTFGSCWLLSRLRGIAKKAPELYNQMIKQDKETGEVTVTIPDRSGEPFIYKISKEQLLELRELSLQCHRNGWNKSKYYSTDIEVIAFEKAFLALEDKENFKILSEVQNYLDNSTIKKPENYKGVMLNEILNMSEKEIEALRGKESLASDGSLEDLIYFIKFTKPKDENSIKPSINSEDYNSYAEYLKALVSYISTVDYELDIDKEKFYNDSVILKPWIKRYSSTKERYIRVSNKAFDELYQYIKVSQPLNGVEKPPISYSQQNVSVRSGGDHRTSFYMLLGHSATVEEYNNGDLSGNKIKKILTEAVQSENKIVCCGFASNNLGFITDHTYLVENIEKDGKKWIVLSNPHNAEKKEYITEKEFLELFESITVATLPDKI